MKPCVFISRDISGTVDVLGIANAAATVTVNGQSASRKGEYFQSAPAYTNTSAALYPFVTNTAILSGNTNTVTGQVFIAKTPETFTYDADGNQTSDGRWTNRWDGENRLITMESLANAPSGSSNRLTFTYDFMGRRVSKQVETWTNSAYSTIVSNKFVYDGWNLVAELNGTNNNAIRTYLWGMDLSGSMQGAGGVGGLLAVKDTVNATHFAAYDGNGNVTGLFSAADGTSSAVYEYDPFGNLLRATGPMAKVNPFRFSTKYQDDETDWSYYGYRFYNAGMGRWLSRDPIEEQGGVAVYGFAHNDAISVVDFFGLSFKVVPQKAKPGTINPGNPSIFGQTWATKFELIVYDTKYTAITCAHCVTLHVDKDFEVEITSIIPSSTPADYNMNGFNYIVAHEDRRAQIYKRAYDEYLEPLKKTIDGRELCCSERFSRFYLNTWALDVVTAHVKAYTDYVSAENKLVSKEMDAANLRIVNGLIDGGNKDYVPGQMPKVGKLPSDPNCIDARGFLFGR